MTLVKPDWMRVTRSNGYVLTFNMNAVAVIVERTERVELHIGDEAYFLPYVESDIDDALRAWRERHA